MCLKLQRIRARRYFGGLVSSLRPPQMFYSLFLGMDKTVHQDGRMCHGIVVLLAIHTMRIQSTSTQGTRSLVRLITLEVMDTRCCHNMELRKVCFSQMMRSPRYCHFYPWKCTMPVARHCHQVAWK